MNPISLLLVTYGRWPYTEASLTYALKGAAPAEIDEVIIVDTIPEPWMLDETQEKLIEYQQKGFLQCGPEKFTVFTFHKNVGSNPAFNKGIELAKKTNDVVIINNDNFLAPNWLQPLIDCAYAPHHAHLVAWCGPYVSPEMCLDEVVNAQFRKDYFADYYQDFMNLNAASEVPGLLNKLYGDFETFAQAFVQRNQGKVYDHLHSIGLIKRSAINAGLGQCDPNFALFLDGAPGCRGSDDIDMWIRIHAAGLFTITTFDSLAHHVVCATTKQRTDPDPQRKNIQGGNRLIEKWEPTDQFIKYPFPTAGNNPGHRVFKSRTTPLPAHKNPFQVDWGLSGEIGRQYMVQEGYARTDAFPF
ncbi:glycosyltransferase [Candidatus Woesearchaeota archaeon]|nr:glycosyltransferase [Candidatus Woesearchaeota archaeon]